jgi:hypothetical protein
MLTGAQGYGDFQGQARGLIIPPGYAEQQSAMRGWRESRPPVRSTVPTEQPPV